MSERIHDREKMEKIRKGCMYAYEDGCTQPVIVEMYMKFNPENIQPDGGKPYAKLENPAVICSLCGGYPKNIEDNGSSMLTTKEVANELGLHVNTVRRWSDLGILNPWRVGPRGDRKYKRDDIISFKKNSSYQFTGSV
jgi:excisionase family DNA binding protein